VKQQTDTANRKKIFNWLTMEIRKKGKL